MNYIYILIIEARFMPVYVPEVGRTLPLHECTQWQLLNLDVDTVCSLESDVLRFANISDASLLKSMLRVS